MIDEKKIDETKYKKYDPDSSDWTWKKLYIPVYPKYQFWNGVDTSSLEEENKVIYFMHNKLKVRGDTVFNFNENNGKRYINNKLLTKEELGNYVKFHHSILNFSLLPSHGFQQAKQGGRRGDRLDVFLYEISSIIENKSWNGSTIKKYCTNFPSGGEPNDIEEFIIGLGDISYFFRTFYFPSEDAHLTPLIDHLLENLLENGKQYICRETIKNWDNKSNLNSYLKLAVCFWKLRKQFLLTYDIDVKTYDDGLDIDSIFPDCD